MALTFNGSTSNYISHNSGLNSNQGTVVHWIYTTDNVNPHVAYMETSHSLGTGDGFGDSASSLNFHTGVHPTGGVFFFIYQDGTGVNNMAGNPSVMEVNTWYHFAASFDRSADMRTYVNGVLDITPVDMSGVTFGGFGPTINHLVGRPTAATRAWSGGMAELAVFNRVVPQAEIALMAEGISPLFFKPVIYMPLVRNKTELMGASTVLNGSLPAEEHISVRYPVRLSPFTAGSGGGISSVPPKVFHYNQLRAQA